MSVGTPGLQPPATQAMHGALLAALAMALFSVQGYAHRETGRASRADPRPAPLRRRPRGRCRRRSPPRRIRDALGGTPVLRGCAVRGALRGPPPLLSRVDRANGTGSERGEGGVRGPDRVTGLLNDETPGAVSPRRARKRPGAVYGSRAPGAGGAGNLRPNNHRDV